MDTQPAPHTESTSVGLAPGWYTVAASGDIGRKPKPYLLNGLPIVTFRDASGRSVALLDRCAHRNAPLSAGRIVDGNIQCHYHGWQFDGSGECKAVPGLCGAPEHAARRVPSFACRDSQGWVWVYSEADVDPESEPYEIPFADQPGYLTIRQRLEMPGPLDAVAENALDVPHTAFVHAGLFRKNKDRKQIEVVIRALDGGAEAQFIGEQRPEGLAGRILAPQGGEVLHWDRFLLPCIAQVEYRLSDRSHIIATTALTPRTPKVTDLFATVAVKAPIPNAILRTVFRPVAMRILRQDMEILRRQTEQVSRFGGEEFASTEIDVLGLRIKKLLREASNGKVSPVQEERRIKMLV
ncbi:MAG: aromatic ring-hydroxylating dioxygenase subunit alpha [Myxococcales bacterium]|nr:MAG: aromatic ring-hydroxylating dioxygenase subunit alpha [Myxococcales bacterium]